MLTSLQKRILSALVLVPVTLIMVYIGGWALIILILTAALISLYEWVQLSQKSKHRYSLSFAGVVYIGLSFLSCYHIRQGLGLEAAFVFVIMIWASDIGAYVVGKNIGGPKMTPNISPNKTWTGFAGALFFPAVALFCLFIINGGFPKDSWGTLFILFGVVGGIVGFAGQAGDLLVSLIKRTVGMKDSGNLIPGHGGLLDRIDSMLLAAPVFSGIYKLLDMFVVS